MHVLLLAENWPPRRGGIENYLFNIATHLADGGVQVTVAAPPGAAVDAGRAKVIASRFFWPGVYPQWLPFFISQWRRAKSERWDITLCGKALFEGLIGYYLKRHLGIPYVVFTYAMEIEDWNRSGRQRRKLQRVLKAADRVVYINETTKRRLLELGVREPQLVKIWPGVDVRAAHAAKAEKAREAVLARHGVQPPYVLTVSRLVPRKGIDLLIEAFGRLDQVTKGHYRLVIAGDGPEHDRLKEAVAKAWIDTSVQWLTDVPDEDLPALYAGAAVFALTPRRDEGFGIVYIEAAAQGVPAVATQVDGAAEAVVHKETGLVVQPTAAAIAEALTYLLDNEGERQRMGAAAGRRVHEQFAWHKRITLIKAMLDAVLAATTQTS